MFCPSKKTAAQQRRAKLLRQPYRLRGTNLTLDAEPGESVEGSIDSVCPAPSNWVNSEMQRILTTYPAFATQLNTFFPNSFAAGEFLADLTADLVNLDGYSFGPGDAIPMVSVCRDEITRPLVDAVEAIWGKSFSLGSIAGMIFTGTTGLGAGMHHAPDYKGIERFVFLVAPHIAISASGVIGQVERDGLPGNSSACGSLIGFLGEMQKGVVNFALNTADLEQSMMKGQISTYFQYAQVPALQDLTKDAQKLILAQLNAALSTFSLAGKAEYAIVSGVQIHGPEESTFFYPTDYLTYDLSGVTHSQAANFSNFGKGIGAQFYPLVQPFAF